MRFLFAICKWNELFNNDAYFLPINQNPYIIMEIFRKRWTFIGFRRSRLQMEPIFQWHVIFFIRIEIGQALNFDRISSRLRMESTCQ